MSANLVPAFPGQQGALAPAGPSPAPVPAPRAAGAGAPVPTEAQVGRLLAAVGRHKWLIAALAAVGAAGGFVASRFVEPTYVVQSSVLITAGLRGQQDDSRGPLRDDQALDAQGWTDLLKTNVIADSVVMKLALYVEPERARDSSAFRGFAIRERFVPGQYTLTTRNGRYTLRDKVGAVNESGVAGDSVGRAAGFSWAPSRAMLAGHPDIAFQVRQPREAAIDILKRLRVRLARGSNLIFVQLTGTAQEKPAETLNAWNEQFIRIATDLKLNRTSQASRALAEQRDAAQQKLLGAERAFEQYRVATAALPSEALAIGGGGGGGGGNPVLDNFVASKYQLEALRRDREQLARVARTLGGSAVPVEALLNVGLVNSDPAAGPLRLSLAEVTRLDVEIRQYRRTLQDSTPPLRGLLEQRNTLAARVVPQQVNDYLAQLRQREGQLGSVVTQSTGELRAIPGRTTQLESLRRERDAAAGLFTQLNARFQESQLAERSLAPDVRVLDTAVLPSQASQNTLSRLLALGLAGGLGLGLAFAILRDRLDRRFRYPVQATHDLGLQILGVVPEIDQQRKQTPEQVAQIVEGFRTVRMNVRYACAPNPRVTLTVTSPGIGDGKSLVASNLALSFAEGGWRTVIVDGDLRRGQLNATFDLPEGPGLTEYLDGTALLGEVVHETLHDNLHAVTTGARHRRGPELLATPRMQQLVAALAAEYDAVIVDSPPLGAGTDAYALATATSNVALVLRRAATDLKMAEVKLETLDTLPVQVIGAVLNEVRTDGRLYQHFAYDPEYVLVEDTERARGRGAAGGDDERAPGGLVSAGRGDAAE